VAEIRRLQRRTHGLEIEATYLRVGDDERIRLPQSMCPQRFPQRRQQPAADHNRIAAGAKVDIIRAEFMESSFSMTDGGKSRTEEGEVKDRTSNAQRPTSNIQWKNPPDTRLRHWMLGVRCWMLDVQYFPSPLAPAPGPSHDSPPFL